MYIRRSINKKKTESHFFHEQKFIKYNINLEKETKN